MEKGRSNYDLQVDRGRTLFLRHDQQTMIEKFRLQADESWIYLDYFDRPCRISRQNGSLEEWQASWAECRSFETVMTIYDLLCYHQGPKLPTLEHQWCAAGAFVVTGVQNTDTFTQDYARAFDGRLEGLKEACARLGGQLRPPLAGADLTCWFPVTKFFPVLLQFWSGDGEFDPRIVLLWDRSTDQLLHYETTFYLQGDLLKRLRICMEGL